MLMVSMIRMLTAALRHRELAIHNRLPKSCGEEIPGNFCWGFLQKTTVRSAGIHRIPPFRLATATPIGDRRAAT